MSKNVRIAQLRDAVAKGNFVNMFPGAAGELLAEIDGLRSVIRGINEHWQAHDDNIGDLLAEGLRE